MPPVDHAPEVLTTDPQPPIDDSERPLTAPEPPAGDPSPDDEDDDEPVEPPAAPPVEVAEPERPALTRLDWLRPVDTRGSLTRALPVLGAVVTLTAVDQVIWITPDTGARILACMTIILCAVPLTWLGSRVTRVRTAALVDNRPGWATSGAWLGRWCAVCLILGTLVAVWTDRGPLAMLLLLTPWAVLGLESITRTSVAHATRQRWAVDELWRTQRVRVLVEKWGRYVAGRRDLSPGRGTVQPNLTKLTGSRLVDVTELPDEAVTAMVTFPMDTAADWRTLASPECVTRVAKVFGVDASLVFVGPHRTGGASRAQLTVHRHDPLRAVQPWRGPTLNRFGRLQVGRYGDGREAFIRLWRGGEGTPHGCVIGATRSGKSGPLGVALVEGMLSRRIVTAFMDPKGGASILGMSQPGRVHHLALEAGHILRMLSAVLAVVEARKREQLVRAKPTPAFPALLAVLDEAPSILMHSPEARAIVSEIVRTGAAFNVSLWLAAQQPTVDQFGGESALRAQAMAGHVFLFRIVDRGGKGVMAGTVLDGIETRLPPNRPGLGFMPGEDETAMRGRAVYLDAESLAIYDRLRAEQGEPITLDPASRAAWDAALAEGARR